MARVAKEKAAADRQQGACRLLAAAVVHLIRAAAGRLWSLEELISALAPEEPFGSAAKEKAAADRRQVACHLLTAAVVRLIQVAAARPWFRGQSASVLGQE